MDMWSEEGRQNKKRMCKCQYWYSINSEQDYREQPEMIWACLKAETEAVRVNMRMDVEERTMKIKKSWLNTIENNMRDDVSTQRTQKFEISERLGQNGSRFRIVVKLAQEKKKKRIITIL